MSENPKKKLDKQAPDKVMSPEQAIVNSAVTQAAATMDLADSLNDLVECLDSLRELAIKIACKADFISPDEMDDYRPQMEPDEDENEDGNHAGTM